AGAMRLARAKNARLLASTPKRAHAPSPGIEYANIVPAAIDAGAPRFSSASAQRSSAPGRCAEKCPIASHGRNTPTRPSNSKTPTNPPASMFASRPYGNANAPDCGAPATSPRCGSIVTRLAAIAPPVRPGSRTSAVLGNAAGRHAVLVSPRHAVAHHRIRRLIDRAAQPVEQRDRHVEVPFLHQP